jgi:signal transduction histidine kinase/ActR/RegA family two-component response regulator
MLDNLVAYEIHSLLRKQMSLAEFGELALRCDDLDKILTEACRLVGHALGTELAKVVELQEDGKTLLVRAGVGWKPGVVGVATIMVADDTSEGVAIKTGEPMISPDIAAETRFRYPAFLIDNGVRAVANVLIIGGSGRQPFGILQIDSREPRQFTENDTTFLRSYANLLAAAVDRIRKLGELRVREVEFREGQRLEAIGRLAAGVAHDFNNVLQSVSGSLELLLEEVHADTPAHEFIDIALTSVRRGSYLTHHLLSYARKQMLEPRPVSLAVFLSELHRMLSHTLGQHIAIVFDVPARLTPIAADPGQLQTALLNLAINGAHAMPTGGTLTVQARDCVEDHSSCVVITVEDTGSGMDQATQAQAFEPFFTTKGPGGSGLGLSMVQGFVEQSGGSIHIDSALGRGTRVELRLPVAVATGRDDATRAPSPELSGWGRILLVDDAADVLLTTAAALERAGFDVTTAASGPLALGLLAEQRFDALVTDYAMPVLDGLDLVAQARVIQPGLVALVVTGFGDVTDRRPGVSFLRKPFKRHELVDALVQSMEHGRRGPGAPPRSAQAGDAARA